MVAGLPHGWFVPVSPGTRQVTIGGAIAADVHGKNHHMAGSFASHVTAFDLLLPGGEPVTVTPDGDPELFWATAGGMGLTGLITRATIRLKRVEVVPGQGGHGEDGRHRRDDGGAGRARQEVRLHGRLVGCPRDGPARSAGRSSPAATSRRSATCRPGTTGEPFAFDPRARLGAPKAFPPGLMNRYSIRLANEAWYRKAPRLREGELQTISQFFHPLDGIRNWNRVYGPGGFRQYQYVMPFGAEAAVRSSRSR